MKTITSELADVQKSVNRKPNSRIVIRDVIPRISSWHTNLYDDGFPSQLDSDNIPQHPYDHNATGRSTGFPTIHRSWCVSESVLRSTMIHFDSESQPELVQAGGNLFQRDRTIDGVHRPTTSNASIYFCHGGNIRRVPTFQSGNGAIYKSGVYDSSNPNHVALACSHGNVIYVAILNEEGDFKYISLRRVDSAGITDCPYTIIVDEDYSTSSLQWFSAERLNNQDIILVNERTYGHTVVLRWKDGVWTEPRPLVKLDDISAVSFLRIGNVNNIPDNTGDQVLWATGRLGRGTKDTLHPQSFDIALRTKDGVHWTIDRYSYLCESEITSKLEYSRDYIYYARGSSLLGGPRPWIMGGSNTDLELDITNDVIGWKAQLSKEGTANPGDTTLTAHQGKYNKDTESSYLGRWVTKGGDLAIVPGMWIWRYAGYSGYESLLSIEGIDTCPGSYQLGDRAFSFGSRDIVMRSLYDWSSDQNWQLLSQVKNHDDCTELKRLYSISSATIHVREEEDKEVTGDVDESEIEEEDGELVFHTPNKVSVNLCTRPADTQNFQIKTRFDITDDSGTSTLISGYVNSTLGSPISSGSYQGGSQFTDSGEDLSDYRPVNDKARYTISVVNTDDTVAWGWIQEGESLDDDELEISQDYEGEDSGWNGVTGTASSYYLTLNDEWARLGTGVGVCGCVTDEYNMIVAFPDLVTKQFYLLVRRGDEDESAWIVWESTNIPISITKGTQYETVMFRRGNKVIAEFRNFELQGIRRSPTAIIEAEWPLDEPMVKLDSEAYNKTDRGKVGVICSISVPESSIGYCASDRDWATRNPDLFVEDEGGTVLKNPYETWEDFVNGYTWNGSSWVVNTDSIPPFYLGGEVYDYDEVDKYDDGDRFGDQWEYSEFELGRISFVYRRWTRPRISPSDRSVRYTGGHGALGPTRLDRIISYYPRRDNTTMYSEYGIQTFPLFFWGEERDKQDPNNDYHVGFQTYREMITGIRGLNAKYGTDRFYAWDHKGDTHDVWNMWHWGNGPTDTDKMPNVRLYPGFYFPNRAHPGQTKQSHAKGTTIRQHWSPELTLHDVWAYDDEPDKTLEWTMKDIAYKAGVTDFDTYYSIDDEVTGVATKWVEDIHGDSVYQKDFDITVELGQISSSSIVRLYFRMQDQSIIHTGAYVEVRADAAELYQSDNGTRYLVDRVYVPGNMGRTIRIVGHEEFITVYNNDTLIGTMCLGPVGEDGGSYTSQVEKAGYMRVYCMNSGNFTIRQPELWAWTDAVILDSRQNAISGLQRCLRDRRVKFVSTVSGGLPTLRMSYLTLPYTTSDITDYSHWLGTFTDHVETDDDFPAGAAHVSVFSDSEGETDRIPTHIRVVGYEIGDYIDHDSASRYGLLFQSHHVPNLEEEEAYDEAGRIVNEALSYSSARQPTISAQMNWEPEDALRLIYTPYDSGPSVDAYYVIDTLSLSFTAEPLFEAQARLRRMV